MRVPNQSKLWNTALLHVSESEADQELLTFLDSLANSHGRWRVGLEIGCGLGRHLLAAMRRGLDMTAVDFSELAVRRTRDLVTSKGYAPGIFASSMTNLPFEDNLFDFTFSWCVLNHGTEGSFEKALGESIRVLRPGGLSYGFVMSRKDSRYGHGQQVGESCFVFTEGAEKGIRHYFPSKNLLESILRRWTDIEEISEVLYGGGELRAIHPKCSSSCHLRYLVSKRLIST